jgi:NADH-quinone oxidoreductase subunit N
MSPLDFSSHGDYLIALLPEMIVALTAMIILMVDVSRRGHRGGQSGAWVGHLTVFGVVLAFVANAWLLGATAAGDGALVAVDAYRVVANFIVLAATLLTAAYAQDYLEREGLRVGEFYALLLLASVGMMILVAARDLIVLFMGLELMSISVYVLTGFARQDPRSSEAALKYFIVGAFASAFLLFGIALVYGAAGSTHLGSVAGQIAEASASGDLILTAGIGLLLIGFGFKIAAVPFHMWTPDAYQGAPTPVTGYMATGVKAAAFVALLRLLTVDLAAATQIWQTAVWWLAFLTMIVPNLVALAQDDVKRMLAYSSVAHAGYLLIGVMASSSSGRAAALFYLAAYTLMTVGAFAIVYHVAGRGDRRSGLADFRGLGWRRPWMGVALVVFLLSLAGFPPTAGFIGKLFLLRAAVDVGQTTLAVTLVLTSLVAYYYYLRVVWKMYFETTPSEATAIPGPGVGFRLATGICAIGLLLFGLFPQMALRGMRRAAEDLTPSAIVASPVEGAAGTTGSLPPRALAPDRAESTDP